MAVLMRFSGDLGGGVTLNARDFLTEGDVFTQTQIAAAQREARAWMTTH